MEIRITTKQVLLVLQIISWIIFSGLSVEAGAILVNTVITLFINPGGVQHFWHGDDYLAAVLAFDQAHFVVITVLMSIVAILKALLFYGIIKLFAEKRVSISQPFTNELRRFILLSAYIALGIGLFSNWGHKYSDGLIGQGMPMADLDALNLAGADVWLFMAVILFVIAQIVKRGIELQAENELTI